MKNPQAWNFNLKLHLYCLICSTQTDFSKAGCIQIIIPSWLFSLCYRKSLQNYFILILSTCVTTYTKVCNMLIWRVKLQPCWCIWEPCRWCQWDRILPRDREESRNESAWPGPALGGCFKSSLCQPQANIYLICLHSYVIIMLKIELTIHSQLLPNSSSGAHLG